jgi:hypothetical protein
MLCHAHHASWQQLFDVLHCVVMGCVVMGCVAMGFLEGRASHARLH